MIALFFSSILSLYLFIIFGTFIAKIGKFPTDLTEKILIGLVVTNTITASLSLFLPINIYILIALLIGCSVLVFFIRDEINTLFYSLQKKKNVILYTLPFILIAFFISIGPPQLWDAGLYHIQSIKWIEEFAVVPGLANLHGRFGFNPNIFTVFALTSLFEIFKQEIFSINFILFSVFVLYFINQLYIIYKQYGINNLFVFNIVVFIAILYFSSNLTDPTPDFISLTFPLFILSKLFKYAVLKENKNLDAYIPMLILCVYVLTVKLAVLPVVILPVLIFFKFRTETRKLIWIMSFFSIIMLPWLIRNVVISGWLIYPFQSLDLFSFDWKVPIDNVIKEKLTVTGWARSPGEHYWAAAKMHINEWFPIWWNRLILTDKVEFLASLFSPLIVFIGYLVKKIKIDLNTFSFLLIPFIGVLFWLILAPDLRFGKTFVITAAISPLLYLKFQFKFDHYNTKYFKPIYVFFAVIIILVPLFDSFSKKYFGSDIIQITQKSPNRIITPQLIERPANMNFKTFDVSGIKIFIPADKSEDRCFDHCIPCIPGHNSSVRLRKKTLQSGFIYITDNN